MSSMSKELFVKEIENGMEFTEFFMLKGMTLRTGANGKTYMDATLSDHTGEINCKKWDLSENDQAIISQLCEGDVIKIKGQITEWNGTKQLKISRIRTPLESDNLNMSDFIKSAPENPNDMFEFITKSAEKITDEGLRRLALNTLEENKERLLYYPGAARNHHAEYAGLLYHMKRMLDLGMKAVTVYTNLDPDWVICGVIMHDMEKLNEIDAAQSGIASGYSMKGKLLGHLVMGAVEMQERAKKAGLSEEKTVMLQHMMISHHYEPDFGSPVKPLFPEAELLHYLDMIDAKMFDFEDALNDVEPGEFSERVRTLDGRMLYKPSFKEK